MAICPAAWRAYIVNTIRVLTYVSLMIRILILDLFFNLISTDLLYALEGFDRIDGIQCPVCDDLHYESENQ